MRAVGRWAAALGVAFAVGVAGGPAAAADSGPVRKVPDTIASDCSVDVTGALNELIAKAPRGTTVELARNGCYRVDGSLAIKDRRDFTLDGNGATLEPDEKGSRDRRHIWVWNGRNIEIRNLEIHGQNPNAGARREAYNPDLAFQHGIAFQGVRGARVDRVSITQVLGDFVYVGPSLQTGKWSRDVRVTRSTFDGSGRQGISVVAGKRITIDRNRIGGTPLSLFDLEANTPAGGAVDVRIVRNVTGPVRHFWLANKGVGTKIRDVVVKGNRTDDVTGGLVFVYGPAPGYRGPFRFVDNTFTVGGTIQDEGSRGAFFLSRAKDVLIRGNRVTLPSGRGLPAVENRNSLDVVVEDNVFTNAGQEMVITGSPVVTSP